MGRYIGYWKFYIYAVCVINTLRLLPVGGCNFGSGDSCTYPCHCEGDAVCGPESGSCAPGCDDGDLGAPGDFYYMRAWTGYGCQIGNVAFNKTATQGPDTWESTSTADKAVDGGHDNILDHGSCIHTIDRNPANERVAAWWEVDLADQYVIMTVIITNRDQQKERLHYTQIHVGEDVANYALCSTWNDVGSPSVYTVNCDSPIKGRYVRVSKIPGSSEEHIMNFCEVQILGYLYEACPGDRYGVACSSLCNCQESCDELTGRCNAGCTAGYRQGGNGINCEEECPNGNWGLGCDNECMCSNTAEDCNHVNGECESGCTSGRVGPGCSLGYPNADTIHLDVDVTPSSFAASFTPPAQDPAAGGNLGYFIEYREESDMNWQTVSTAPNGGQMFSSVDDFGTETLIYLRIVPYVESGGILYEGEPGTEVGPYNITGASYTSSETSSGDVAVISAIVVIVVLITIAVVLIIVLKRKGYLDGILRKSSTNDPMLEAQQLENKEGYDNPAMEMSNEVERSRKKSKTTVTYSAHGSPALPLKKSQKHLLGARYLSDTGSLRIPPSPKPSPVPSKHSVLAADSIADSVMETDDEMDTAEMINNNEYGNVTPVGRRIKVNELAFYLDTMSKKPDAYRQEFGTVPNGVTAKYEAGAQDTNRPKNRYNNVYAYDHSRVVLDMEDADIDDTATDYVNACYMHGYNAKEKVYIATQGPLPTTCADFWRMVWQTGANRIVMVTQFTEDKKEKCAPYWDDDKALSFGQYSVKVSNQENWADYTVRLLSLTNTKGESRQIHHFHFIGWPDKKTPEIATPLLEFRRKVRSVDAMAKGPMIVHCSAGIGRTGTFMAMDTMLMEAKKDKKIDLLRYVNLMRSNRKDMIQVVEQYIFVYQAVLEQIQCGNVVIPCSQMDTAYPGLKIVSPDSGKSKLKEQYETLGFLKPETREEESVALKEENLKRNRSASIIPANRVRPRLTTPVPDTTDYIMANYVDGYREKQAFIMTQNPFDHTVCDFWRLVYDHKSTTIVLLCDMYEHDPLVPIYWPTSVDTPSTYGPLTVTFSSEVESAQKGVNILEFSISYEEIEEVRTVRLYHMFSWREEEFLLPSPQPLLDLYEQVEKWQLRNGNKVVIVACMFGNNQSAMYICGKIIVEKMKAEQEVDVFHAVKLVRLGRPDAIHYVSQYEFLHDLAVKYMENNSEYANFK